MPNFITHTVPVPESSAASSTSCTVREEGCRAARWRAKQTRKQFVTSGVTARTCLSMWAILFVCRTSEAACPYLSTTQNIVQQWNRLAEDAVVALPPNGAGALQNEGLLYMGAVQAAVYDAVVAIEGVYEPYAWRPGTLAEQGAAAGASVEAAVIEAAYQVLRSYFPSQAPTLDECHDEALASVDGGTAKIDGVAIGSAAAAAIISVRANDGRQPIGTVSTIDNPICGPGGYRLTPGAGWTLGPQTPWLGNVTPFLLRRGGQFGAPPPPELTSRRWIALFDEVKRLGGSTSTERTPEQTAIARFWTANVVRQYNLLGRDLISQRALTLAESARLLALLNMVMADAQINVFHAKYQFLFWRPVTAIDPTSVTSDWCDTVPGYTDGNDETAEEVGWRPLLNTPNQPEYPGAHGSITGAVAEVLSEFFGTDQIQIDVYGFDAAGAAGNLNAVRHFDTADQLREEIVNARLWGGLHYRRSSRVAIRLGTRVARYGLNHGLRIGGSNLLDDPGFEEDEPPSLAAPGWVSDSFRQTAAFSETHQPRTGAQNGACWTADYLDCGLYQDVTAPATGTYSLTVFATADRDGGLVGANVNGSGVVSAPVASRAFGDYVAYTMTFSANTGDAIRVWMYSPAAPGYVVIDDVSLLGPPPSQ